MPSDQLPLPLQIISTALFVASLAVWAIVIRRSRSGKEIVPYEPRRPVPWQGVDLAVVLIAFMLAAGLVSHAILRSEESKADPSNAPAATQSKVPVNAASDKGHPHAQTVETTDLIAGQIAMLLTAGAAVGWVMYRVRATPKDLGFGVSRFGSDLRLGAATFLAAYLPVLGLQDFLTEFIPYEHPLIESLTKRPDAMTLTLTGISAVLIAPLFEELLFRVLIQGCLEAVEAKRRWLLTVRRSPGVPILPPNSEPDSPTSTGDSNPYRSPSGGPRPIATEGELVAVSGPAMWPIVVTSTLFALMHLGQGPAPIPLFLFSLLLGYVYQRTHRIWPSLIAHFLLNGMTMAALWYKLVYLPK
jgi:membrane protease YdiL (CAAX protease family)